MKLITGLFVLALAATGFCMSAAAQDSTPAPIPFAGGTLTIEQPEEYGEKIVAFDGKELARNFYVFFNGIVKVAGVDVALFEVGNGGNACGPAMVMIWKPEGGAIRRAGIGEDDCGAPPAGISSDAIYFVPWLLPGASGQVKKWSPADGFMLAGTLTYTPDPGSGWADIDPSKYQNIIDAFHNEAVYGAARKLLGNEITDMATSLLVGGGTEKISSGIFYARGCVPHDCGGNDGFMAIDVKARKLYFARMTAKPQPDAWPALKAWPAELRSTMKSALTPPQ